MSLLARITKPVYPIMGGLVVVTAILVCLLLPNVAKASIFDGWYGIYDCDSSGCGFGSEGYFHHGGFPDTRSENRGHCAYSGACPLLPNGNYTYDAIDGNHFRQGNNSTASSIQMAHDFVQTLKNYYYSGDQWSWAGSSFIVNTMLGYNINDSRKTRNLTQAMWDDLEIRLVDRASKGRINWNIDTASDYQDTYTRVIGGVYDVVYDQEYNIRNGILVYNDNGTAAYRIWYLCANPSGAMDGLPIVSYNLTPNMSATPSTSEGGAQATLTPTVKNDGPASTSSTQWQVTTFNLAPNVAIPAGGDNNKDPVVHYGNSASVIGSGTQNYSLGINSVPIGQQTIIDLPVGSKVCYTLSIRPYNQSTGDWRHGTPFCVTISKKPKVNIIGNDLIVGKGTTSQVTTSSTTKLVDGSTKTFGSWGEYGILASGLVKGIASGAGYSGGSPSNAFCDASLLTFTNSGSTTCSDTTTKGSYAMNSILPDIGSRLIAGSSLGNNPTINIATTAKGTYSATGTVNLTSSGPVQKGKWVVINAPTATVTISSDIIYTTDSLQALTDIPQVIIIANRIIIQASVSQVDAWLVATGATGSVNTCAEVTDPTIPGQLSATKCTTPLIVNGPVIARHLYLYRTAGSGQGGATGAPAETFNFRPDAYLWATGYLSSGGRLQTATTKELPPRF